MYSPVPQNKPANHFPPIPSERFDLHIVHLISFFLQLLSFFLMEHIFLFHLSNLILRILNKFLVTTWRIINFLLEVFQSGFELIDLLLSFLLNQIDSHPAFDNIPGFPFQNFGKFVNFSFVSNFAPPAIKVMQVLVHGIPHKYLFASQSLAIEDALLFAGKPFSQNLNIFFSLSRGGVSIFYFFHNSIKVSINQRLLIRRIYLFYCVIAIVHC